MRAAAIALAAMTATGCATAFDQALRRAEAAGEAGDRIGAAIAYREACALRRDGTDACARAEQATRAAIDEALAQARCEEGDAPSCLKKLRAARDLSPEDPALLAAVDGAADRHTTRCGEVDGLESIVPVLGCMDRIERQVDRRWYSTRIADEARTAADLVAQISSDSPGAALVVASLASCFGDSAAATREREIRLAFAAKTSVAVWPRLQVSGAHIRDADLCAGLPAAAFCEPHAETTIEVQADVGPTRHRVDSETRAVRYAAGEISVPNPAYAEAEARRQQALWAVQELEPRVVVGQARCDAARRDSVGTDFDSPARRFSDRACDESRALESLLSDRRFELRKAESDLSSTPSTSTETVYADHRYVVERHLWSVDFDASVGGRWWSETLRREDSTHPAFPPAGVAGDPLDAPDRTTFVAEVADRLRDAFANAVQRELSARAAERRRACEGAARWETEWMSCWAEATFLRGRSPDARLFLRELAGADAPRCR